jgi:hypothetical protein
MLVPESAAVSGLFGAVAAASHAAPSSCLPPGTVNEYEGAARPLAGFDIGEIDFTHESRQRFADRQQ